MRCQKKHHIFLQEDKEKKRLELLDRKKELQKLHDEEMESIKARKPATVDKLTRAQIVEHVEKERRAAAGTCRDFLFDFYLLEESRRK